MAQEINLGGTIYISSKRAAEITGYTQDYIGQLARGGHITAQRVSGLWYVVEESLRGYKAKADEFKPTPPPPPAPMDLDSSISFDGRDYVSAQRGADITGYHQDYVGQLARSGKVLSRQIGNRWYVDREELIEHKRHNDALLAAVQAESVGLQRDNVTEVPLAAKDEPLHYTYTPENPTDLMPETESRESDISNNNDISDEDGGLGSTDIEHEIPIRVIQPNVPRTHRYKEPRSGRWMLTGVSMMSIILIATGVGYLYFTNMPAVVAAYDTVKSGTAYVARKIPMTAAVSSVEMPIFLDKYLAKQLYFRRDDF